MKSIVIFDRSFGFDDGLSEKCIKELSIQQARAMLTKKLYLGGQIVRHYHDSLDYPGEIAAAIPGESFDFGFLSNSAEWDSTAAWRKVVGFA